MAVLATLALLAWPHRPAPLGPAEAWSQRAAPAVDALALDVSSASAQPQVTEGMVHRLAGDVARAERVGAPPDPGRRTLWRTCVAEVRTALSQAQTDPAAARSALNLAALEISGLSAAAQAQ